MISSTVIMGGHIVETEWQPENTETKWSYSIVAVMHLEHCICLVVPYHCICLVVPYLHETGFSVSSILVTFVPLLFPR